MEWPNQPQLTRFNTSQLDNVRRRYEMYFFLPLLPYVGCLLIEAICLKVSTCFREPAADDEESALSALDEKARLESNNAQLLKVQEEHPRYQYTTLGYTAKELDREANVFCIWYWSPCWAEGFCNDWFGARPLVGYHCSLCHAGWEHELDVTSNASYVVYFWSFSVVWAYDFVTAGTKNKRRRTFRCGV
jgi:hypothetical protein